MHKQRSGYATRNSRRPLSTSALGAAFQTEPVQISVRPRSPSLAGTPTDLPPLEFHQTRRVDHRLILGRH